MNILNCVFISYNVTKQLITKSNIMYTATLSSRFQIFILKKIREQLYVITGQQMVFILKGNCLELVPKHDIHEFKNILTGANTQNIRDRNDRK